MELIAFDKMLLIGGGTLSHPLATFEIWVHNEHFVTCVCHHFEIGECYGEWQISRLSYLTIKCRISFNVLNSGRQILDSRSEENQPFTVDQLMIQIWHLFLPLGSSIFDESSYRTQKNCRDLHLFLLVVLDSFSYELLIRYSVTALWRRTLSWGAAPRNTSYIIDF